MLSKLFTYPRALVQTFMFTKGFPYNDLIYEKYQLKKLRKILIFSYKNFPFYKERMDSVGFNPYTFKSITEFKKIPVLTKPEYKKFVEDIIKQNPDKYSSYYKDGTSGSTGQPLKVLRTWEERSYMITKWLTAMRVNGYSFFHRTFSLPSPHRIVKRDSWVQGLGFGRRYTVSYTDTVENMIKGYIKAKPDFFYANKSQILLMAQEVLKRRLKIKSPKYYAVTSETLDENSKRIIQSVFGRDNMFEVYGAVELGGVLAIQVKGKEGLFFYHHTNFLELNNMGVVNAESGNCIITDYYIKSFPLIRYRLGDWIELCMSENKTFPKIKKIRGREDDWVLLPDGSKIPFHPFYEIMEKRNEVIQFRIIQNSISEISVQIVLKNRVKQTDFKNQLIEELRSQISNEILFNVEFVEQILPDPNGKLRMIVSRIKM